MESQSTEYSDVVYTGEGVYPVETPSQSSHDQHGADTDDLPRNDLSGSGSEDEESSSAARPERQQTQQSNICPTCQNEVMTMWYICSSLSCTFRIEVCEDCFFCDLQQSCKLCYSQLEETDYETSLATAAQRASGVSGYGASVGEVCDLKVCGLSQQELHEELQKFIDSKTPTGVSKLRINAVDVVRVAKAIVSFGDRETLTNVLKQLLGTVSLGDSGEGFYENVARQFVGILYLRQTQQQEYLLGEATFPVGYVGNDVDEDVDVSLSGTNQTTASESQQAPWRATTDAAYFDDGAGTMWQFVSDEHSQDVHYQHSVSPNISNTTVNLREWWDDNYQYQPASNVPPQGSRQRDLAAAAAEARARLTRVHVVRAIALSGAVHLLEVRIFDYHDQGCSIVREALANRYKVPIFFVRLSCCREKTREDGVPTMICDGGCTLPDIPTNAEESVVEFAILHRVPFVEDVTPVGSRVAVDGYEAVFTSPWEGWSRRIRFDFVPISHPAFGPSFQTKHYRFFGAGDLRCGRKYLPRAMSTEAMEYVNSFAQENGRAGDFRPLVVMSSGQCLQEEYDDEISLRVEWFCPIEPVTS